MGDLGEFGPYELRELIGRGGAGEVYEAYDRESTRVVALKVLSPEHADDPQYRARFRREAMLAARLRDPHVVPIHRYGEIDGRLYLDMRLVEGVDLEQMLAREGPLPPDRAVALVGQVAGALSAAHSDGLVHRDVKPSNVLVTTGHDGEDFAYLADFGITRSTGPSSTGLTRGMIVGTADYVAPEQCRNESEARSDVYALACVLFRCLTGSVPYPGRDLPAVLSAHLWEQPPLVSERAPHLGTRFDDVVREAMAKDPAERTSTAVEFARQARAAAVTWRADAGRSGPAPGSDGVVGPARASGAPAPTSRLPVPDEPVPSGGSTGASPRSGDPVLPGGSSVAGPVSGDRVPAGHGPGGVAGPVPGRPAPGRPGAGRPGSHPDDPLPGSAFPDGSGGTAPSRSPGRRGTGRRRRTVGVAAVAALLVLAGVVVAVTWDRGPAAAAPGQAPPVSTALPRVVNTLALPGRPETVAVGLDGTRAYATTSDPTAPALHVIDTVANREVRSVPLPGVPRFVAVSPATGNVYVSYNDRASDRLMLAGYDVRLEKIVKLVPTGQREDRKTGQTWLFVMAISPDGKRVYVPHHDASVVSVVDTDRNAPVAQIPMPRNPHSVAIAPDERRAWVTAHASGEVDVIDLRSNTFVTSIPIAPGASPHDVDVSGDGAQVQVANFDAATVSWVDVATNRVAGTIPIGGKPQSIVFAPDGRRSYVVDNQGSRVVTIDSATHGVTGSVPVARGASMIALSPDGTRAYVASRESGTITTLLTAS
ncbi:serine/threonine-protein kinase [Pseudonocardia endophytica]|uniref:non-specific serine/threonine protein kinase n=1 Tax=Pseudonocardia endophytica TaxID=401976 RepID=A0A4R1HTC0_PSEEN|nr:protein kinase [Pseudonocardia endophytica]TCK25924.1 serine/threonine-protein kinase [Pseudonocardia endophytica]